MKVAPNNPLAKFSVSCFLINHLKRKILMRIVSILSLSFCNQYGLEVSSMMEVIAPNKKYPISSNRHPEIKPVMCVLKKLFFKRP